MALIAQVGLDVQLLAAPATNPPQSTAQLAVAVAGVLAGLLVGLGAPWLNSLSARRSGRSKEQHIVADQILQLWQRPEGVRELLVDDLYGTRRSLLLLGSRLQEKKARNACLTLVHTSAQRDSQEDDIVDGWTDVVMHVSEVYRKAGG